MTQDLVSKRTRTEFREFLVGWTLREIEIEFDSVGIACNGDFDPQLSGQRRSLVEQFYHTLDFTDPDDITKLLQAYENILNKARRNAEAMAESTHNASFATARQGVAELIRWLEKDGFAYRDGRIVRPAKDGELAANTISEVTRRNIEDFITVANVDWSGRLTQDEFLARVYELNAMPSGDFRFETAADDIIKHTVLNDDWSPDWVFQDSRFDLRHCPDEEYIRFLGEIVHPVVRVDQDEVTHLVTEFNSRLEADGWRLAPSGEISGRPVFAGERIGASAPPTLAHAKTPADKLGPTPPVDTTSDIVHLWTPGHVRLFVTHKADYKLEASKLKDALDLWGVSCFVAHEDIEPTREWQQEIEKALFTMDVLAALMTDDFSDSKWTDQEIGVAIGRQIPIIPVKIGTDPYGFIGKYQALSATGKKPSQVAQELYDLLWGKANMTRKLTQTLITRFEKADNFNLANKLMGYLERIESASPQEIERLERARKENSQVSGAFDVKDRLPSLISKLRGTVA